MPPRWLSVLIVVSWLAAMGWLLGHDLLPLWRADEPPAFYIDLVEEVQNPNRLKTAWNVQRQKEGEKEPRDIFRALSWVDYQPESDTFTLHAQLESKKANPRPEEALTLSLPKLHFTVQSISSEYRVTRTGQLRELRSRLGLSFRMTQPREDKGLGLLKDTPKEDADFVLWGEVRGEQFFAHCQASAELAEKPIEFNLPPAPVSHNASVLMPLHPVNRIHGLRPGQSWRQPLVDPIRDALSSLLGPGGIHSINARVLPQPQVLRPDDDREVVCLVIEYEDEGEFVGRTWVEQDSERVEQQEAIVNGDHWFLKRDNPRKAAKRRFRFPAVDPQP